MPWKVGKKIKTRGWQILKNEKGSWQVVGYSDSKQKAKASIRARYASEWRKNSFALLYGPKTVRYYFY